MESPSQTEVEVDRERNPVAEGASSSPITDTVVAEKPSHVVGLHAKVSESLPGESPVGSGERVPYGGDKAGDVFVETYACTSHQ